MFLSCGWKTGPIEDGMERMDRRRYRLVLRLAIVLVAGLGVWMYVLWQNERNRVAIENRSLQPITELEMTAGKQNTTIDNIPPGAVVPIPDGITGKQALRVKVLLKDGSRTAWFGIPKEGEHLYILPGGSIEAHQPDREGKR
jgi:hypothetical protein